MDDPAAPSLAVVERPSTTPPGARVVLVHGAMDRGGSFGRVANRLRDLDVVTYDRRGYAGSSAVGPATSFDEQVADLLEVLDRRPSVVAGHSFGGNVVLTAAERHPDLVRAAVVFEPPAPWQEWWPGTTQRSSVGRTPEETAEAFMRRMVGDRIWDMLPASTRSQRRAEGATLLAELRSLGGRRPYDPGAVTVPVIVGWGTESPEHMVQAARILAGELPRATAVEVQGSNHGVHLSHPSEMAAMIRTAVDLSER